MNDLVTALKEAQKEINHAVKDGKTHFGGYPTLEAVINTVKPALNKYGIYFLQKTHPNETGATVETIFYGHGSELSAGLFSLPATKNNAQQFGSALTYCRRYSLATACGIGAKDDDGQASTEASDIVEEEEITVDHLQNMIDDLNANAEGQKSAKKIYENHFKLAEMAQDHELCSQLTAKYESWFEQKVKEAAEKNEN